MIHRGKGSGEVLLRRGLHMQRGVQHFVGQDELCCDWETDEIETGMNPYRPPSRPPVNEWGDIDLPDELAEWTGAFTGNRTPPELWAARSEESEAWESLRRRCAIRDRDVPAECEPTFTIDDEYELAYGEGI